MRVGPVLKPMTLGEENEIHTAALFDMGLPFTLFIFVCSSFTGPLEIKTLTPRKNKTHWFEVKNKFALLSESI